ncbi:hypothetical protein C1882_13875 [Pseudomonas sp. FW305-E2]|uniref:Lar family restriction alleviation protein n=1 Tax=Pseudomonas sp. FW305-E2 TaxID=2075558 RepID=UPI000B4F2D85|nr:MULTISPECIES: Lar family restriction alleviation protein [Pseudomonas]POA85072.1 hypothetical protein C1882_13875 [Pseudomonas sp. FW305-E2]
MPTENRSSNTEMVSELLPCPFCGQQDVLIERLDNDASVVICQGLTGPHEACLACGPVGVAQNEGEEQPGRDKAVELWNSRAQQHQGEPVLWRYRKTPARGWFYSVHKRSAEIALRDGYIVEEFYAHTDPGDVERLRGENKQLKDLLRKLSKACKDKLAIIESQRAELAERDGLLDRVVDHANFWRDHPYAEVVEAIARDYKALSASAESSAPVAQA